MPLMANMVEGGKTPILSAPELAGARLPARHLPRRRPCARSPATAAGVFYASLWSATAPPRRSATACSTSRAINALDRHRRMLLARGKRYEDAEAADDDRSRHAGRAEGPARADRRRDGRDAVTAPRSTRSSPRRTTPATASTMRRPATRWCRASTGLPIFVGAMAFAVKAVIDKAAREGELADGDIYIFNDPYDGGTHLSDFRWCGRSSATAGCSAGSPRSATGTTSAATCPGNYNPVATECLQEGVLIPPVKLFARGRAAARHRRHPHRQFARCRSPIYGDLNGQINALDLGERRLARLLDEYGDGDGRRGARCELRRARGAADARATSRRCRTAPISFEDYLDNDGIVDEPLTIALDLTIAGDADDARFLALRRRPAPARSTSRARPRSPAAMSR